jgi:hypothetical protein
MATVVLTQHTIGAPFNGTTHNNNLQLIENSLADLGPYVISGLTFAAGTGLSATVASGVADIGGRITSAGFTITGLTDSTVNHLYILNTGAGAHNTTGTAPANSAKLGTATTAGGVVTSVAMGRTSGRQQFQQPQNLVHGGPSAGTASAGHPRAVNLAQWNATQAEGFEVFGALPAGAADLSAAVILAPAASSRNVIQPTVDGANALSLKQHSPTYAGNFLSVLDSTGTVWTSINANASLAVNALFEDGTVLNVRAGQSYAITSRLAVFDAFDGASNLASRFCVTKECNLQLLAPTTGSTSNEAGRIVQGMLDNTAGTFKGRLDLVATDSGGQRTAVRIEADGTNPLTHILGSLSAPRVSTSSNTTLNGSHFSIFEDTTGGNKTVTLPTAVGIDGRIYCVKNVGTGANTLTIATTSAQTIDGAAGASTTTPQACLILQSDGANWQTLSSN